MRKLTVLAVIFVALAAFVYFYEIAGEEEREKAQELEESLFRVEEDEISALIITRNEAETVALKKSDDKWMIEEPIEASADESTVNGLLGSIERAKRAKSFDDADAQFSAYGLDNPSAVLNVTAGEVTKTLEFGSKDYTGSQIYVRFSDEQKVYLTSLSLLTSLEKDLLDWRNKDAISFERARVEAIQIDREKDRVELVKQDDSWRLESPIQEKADDGKVSSLLSSLESARAESFVTEEAESLDEYGLGDPATIVRVREEGEDSWHQLELGALAGGEGTEDETWFARDPQRTSVFTLKRDLFDDLQQDVWEFRDKDVIDVKQDQIERLSIKRDDSEIIVRREDYKWIFELPEELKDKEALSYKLWYPLDDIQFDSIEDEAGSIAAPDVEVVITLLDGTTRTYRFLEDGESHLALKMDSGQRGTISHDDFEKLTISPDELAAETVEE